MTEKQKTQAIDLLRRARARLARRGGWTVGREVWSGGPAASVSDLDDVEVQEAALNGAFCARGAIRIEARLTGENYMLAERLLADEMRPLVPRYHRRLRSADIIAAYNDGRGSKRPVLDKFDRALDKAEPLN